MLRRHMHSLPNSGGLSQKLGKVKSYQEQEGAQSAGSKHWCLTVVMWPLTGSLLSGLKNVHAPAAQACCIPSVSLRYLSWALPSLSLYFTM